MSKRLMRDKRKPSDINLLSDIRKIFIDLFTSNQENNGEDNNE